MKIENDLAERISLAQDLCHGLAREAGWWDIPAGVTAARKALELHDTGGLNIEVNTMEALLYTASWKPNVPEKLCLTHSEISEAMEGDRKNLMDDHLPHRKMIEVELADAIIRILDLAGYLELDVGGAMVEKLHYNTQRADHKRENRDKSGGKQY